MLNWATKACQPFIIEHNFLSFSAIRETEFGTRHDLSFWRYLWLQKRTVTILLFAYTAVLTSRAFIYNDVYNVRAPNNWHIALFRVLASTAAIFSGLLIHRKGNYNCPVLVWCFVACLLLVYKTLALDHVSEQLYFSTGKIFGIHANNSSMLEKLSGKHVF